MKHVLVTGGAGFIGSEVVRQLIAKGYDVTVADNLSKPESSVKQGYRFEKVDLRDEAAATRVMEGHDTCINMAALIGGIGYFHKIPADILGQNNRIYTSTFEAARHAGIERMVFISSSMVFESAVKFPSKETDLPTTYIPRTAYGFSKLSGEWYCHAYKDQYDLNFSIVRPFNAYGVGERPEDEPGFAHVIPDLVKKILGGQYPLQLLGSGEQSRCFTHISDVAAGIVTVAEHPKAINEDFNISTPEETKIKDLAESIWNIIGMDKPFSFELVSGFKDDVKRRVPDVTKAKHMLGFEAKVPLSEGLPTVVQWVRENMKKV